MRMFIAVLVVVALMSGKLAAEPSTTLHISSYSEILNATANDMAIHRFSENQDIHVFDFSSLERQGEMFNRITALVERIGAARDRVMNDDELAQHIRSTGRTAATFAFGNDFRISEIVVFFNLAEHASVKLNASELLFRDILIDLQLVAEKYGFLQVAGRDRIVLSIPQEQDISLESGDTLRITAKARDTILRHEISHGEYYTNRLYADFCRRFWRAVMSGHEREAFRQFLGQRGYDVGNEEMMINETQAYLMHTHDPRAFSPEAVKLPSAAIERLRVRFTDLNPPTALGFVNGGR